MKIKLNWLRRSKLNTSSTLLEYYTDLDKFPLSNWIKCTENADYTYLRIDRKKGSEEITAEDLEAWRNMYDQYIRKYGLSKVYKRLLEVMREKALIECEYVITRDRFKLTLLKLKEEELKAKIANGGHGMSIEQSLIHLSKWIGYHLNAQKIYVTEYFNLLSEYGKANNIERNNRK